MFPVLRWILVALKRPFEVFRACARMEIVELSAYEHPAPVTLDSNVSYFEDHWLQFVCS